MSKLLLSLILLISFSFNAFAEYKIEGIEIDYDLTQSLITSHIGKDQTCLDEYLTREQQLKKFLIWAPPVALVGVPASFAAAGFIAGAISGALGLSGWNAIGYTVGAAFGAGIISAGTFVTLEVTKGIQFANMRKMTNLINASHNSLYESKALYKLYKKYNRKFPEDAMSVKDLAATVVMLDETGLLCDGEVREKEDPDPVKLKHKLARRKDLIKYIHYNLNKGQ